MNPNKHAANVSDEALVKEVTDHLGSIIAIAIAGITAEERRDEDEQDDFHLGLHRAILDQASSSSALNELRNRLRARRMESGGAETA